MACKTRGDVLTGFKWIGGTVDEFGPREFLIGCEEAHGYMVGGYVRDKDAAAAAMLLAELAAELKTEQLTLHQGLARLHALLGYHQERTVTRTLPGSAGLEQMSAIMHTLRPGRQRRWPAFRCKRSATIAGASRPMSTAKSGNWPLPGATCCSSTRRCPAITRPCVPRGLNRS